MKCVYVLVRSLGPCAPFALVPGRRTRCWAERWETHQSCQNRALYNGCFRTSRLTTQTYGSNLHHLGSRKIATHLTHSPRLPSVQDGLCSFDELWATAVPHIVRTNVDAADARRRGHGGWPVPWPMRDGRCPLPRQVVDRRRRTKHGASHQSRGHPRRPAGANTDPGGGV